MIGGECSRRWRLMNIENEVAIGPKIGRYEVGSRRRKQVGGRK